MSDSETETASDKSALWGVEAAETGSSLSGVKDQIRLNELDRNVVEQLMSFMRDEFKGINNQFKAVGDEFKGMREIQKCRGRI